VKELGHLIPNNELIILPDSTHEMPADNPKAYNEVVLSFLGKHSE
jgi:pimeloyl-ACP methyl ester carboxylesterase